MVIYFDNSATTQVSEKAAAKALEVMRQNYGNPSSLYSLGLAAEKIVQDAREKAALAIGAQAEEIYFTGCGTESNNWAFKGLAEANRKGKKNHLVITAIEHPAILQTAKALENHGYQVSVVMPQKDGRMKASDLLAKVKEETLLVSCMHVNNETGVIQPIAEIGCALAALSHKVYFHVDAVQSFAKLPIDVKKNKIDFLSASGHKIHAPKGIGLLYVKKGVRILPLLNGGGQEKGMRSGTENVPGIAAFGVAIAEALAQREIRMQGMQAVCEALCTGLQKEQIEFYSNSQMDENGVPYILNLSFPGAPAEVLLHYLEQDGICVSAGSACSSRKDIFSHVLQAMDLPKERLASSLRFSFSGSNTVEEAQIVAKSLAKAVREIRGLRMK